MNIIKRSAEAGAAQSWTKLKTITSVIVVWVSLTANPVKADSPLTSTDLTSGYENLSIVNQVKQTKTMDKTVTDFLLSSASLDKKAAVINGLSWNYDGQNNGELFLQALMKKKRFQSIQDLKVKDLTAEEKFVYGYILAMDNYLSLSALTLNSPESMLKTSPLEYLSQAAFALPNDFTVHFIKSLVEAQLEFNYSWCAVYLSPTEVLQRFPENRRNLNPLAVSEAMEYMNGYRDYCFGSK